jgi:hypothetical protein
MRNLADKSMEQLEAIIAEFNAFLSTKGKASESDTRVKVVERILKEVCQWPETQLSREDKVNSGYTDYQLKVRNAPTVAVEAKREGLAFTLPSTATMKSLKLNGVLVTDPQVKEAISQVRQYCDDEGIKYALATNGYTWIVFRAIRDDMPWREGRARIFPSIEYIKEHFVEFWNLLSYQAICEGSLDDEFGFGLPASRKLLRVIDKLYNADLPLRRNRLNTQLRPIVTYIFEDIAAQEDSDLLQSCYVHTGSLRIVAEDLNVVITDAIPQQLIEEGTQPIGEKEDDFLVFNDKIEKAIRTKRGGLYLLLGGIGSGKTTFLKRYEKILAKNLLNRHAYTFNLDFLKAPIEIGELEPFLWGEVLDTLRHKYAADAIEERSYLKTLFKDKLKNLERTALRGVKKHTEGYEQAIGPYLLQWQENTSDYVPKLLKFASVIKNKSVVLFIDNVDQLDPDYQAQIFLLAQRITRLAASITIIALREESYYAPSIQNIFTAYTSHKFHIASPQFRAMIINRIEYAIRMLEGSEVSRDTVLKGYTFDTLDICEFLRIVQNSVFEWSRRILALFIECLCFGNMRLSLQMFTTFLTSGATDADKMLLIYRRSGAYHVAFHEFLKSVMLQDRAYYKEDQSPVLNVFNCTSQRNASHFTALRILILLLEHRSESSPEGRGYVELSRLVGTFAEVFDNVKDVSNTLDRLVTRQLIEVNTRSTRTVSGASHVRVTAAGWYYVNYLSHKFAYLDLVLQDTPLNDDDLEVYLRQSVYEVNNLTDREQEKFARMQVRFNRTQKFLTYLCKEEEKEYDAYGLAHAPRTLRSKFMPNIQTKFQREREYIEHRLVEGRMTDAPDEPTENVAAQFDILIDEPINAVDENGDSQNGAVTS